jgi:hypothetical protein
MAKELRKERIQDPKLERALFQTRKNWNDLMIKKHVYAVGLANIFEWVLISRRAGLVDKRVWEEWLYVWQKVVLKDKCMAEKFTDPSVYTFSHIEAYNMVRKMVEDENYRPPDPYRGFFGR